MDHSRPLFLYFLFFLQKIIRNKSCLFEPGSCGIGSGSDWAQPVPIFILFSSFSFQDKRQSQSRPFWLKSCGLYLPKWTLAEMTFTFNFVEKKVFFAILVENFWLNALIVLML